MSSIESIVDSLKSSSVLTPEQIDLLKFSSHSIKGSAYNLCFERLGNIAKHIEMTSREWGCPEAGSKGEMLPYLYKLLTEEWSIVLSLMKI
jgi:HPt (histidine-containing phosphotransfer) domain-containing protein